MKSTPTSPDGLLSPRQKQIVTLIAQDLTVEEIGKHLEITPKTVEFHLDFIKQKLNVADTAGIVRYAIHTGLIVP